MSQNSKLTAPELINLDATPEEVANGLRHLPGLVFLDSSVDDSENEGDHHVSLVSASPVSVLTGNIFDPADREALHNLWKKNRVPEMPDLGYPCGGLIGSIEYEGQFQFGCYPHMLIYDHRDRQWREVGDLSKHYNCLVEFEKTPGPPGIDFLGTMTREEFCDHVSRAREYIAAGDIYQVNLSHRMEADWISSVDAFSLYRRLRDSSPAPFAAYLQTGKRTVLSSSPEQFLQISGKSIQTRPIKGTRPRFRDRAQDEKSAYDLITSPKEIAELIMITDLERNDLGQVCEFGTVEVTELLKLERFAQVFHLVSTVEGTLRDEINPIEALHACFPGGSITGAPKKRAREIIAELEPVPRGLYTGTIGCFGFNGESRFNIAIRTAIVEDDKIHFHVGAGIVADSRPQMEWEETLHKAAGILRACGSE